MNDTIARPETEIVIVGTIAVTNIVDTEHFVLDFIKNNNFSLSLIKEEKFSPNSPKKKT